MNDSGEMYLNLQGDCDIFRGLVQWYQHCNVNGRQDEIDKVFVPGARHVLERDFIVKIEGIRAHAQYVQYILDKIERHGMRYAVVE